MSLFAWRSEYTLHHPQIDQQHRTLFHLADELHYAMTRGAGRAMVAGTLAELVRYTAQHFRDEETLMRADQYPDFAAHKAEHDTLTAQVLELNRRVAAEQIAIPLETLQFLRDWLDKHIKVADRKIATYVANAAPGLSLVPGSNRLAPSCLDHDRRCSKTVFFTKPVHQKTFNRKMQILAFVSEHQERGRSDGRLGDIADVEVLIQLQV